MFNPVHAGFFGSGRGRPLYCQPGGCRQSGQTMPCTSQLQTGLRGCSPRRPIGSDGLTVAADGWRRSSLGRRSSFWSVLACAQCLPQKASGLAPVAGNGSSSIGGTTGCPWRPGCRRIEALRPPRARPLCQYLRVAPPLPGANFTQVNIHQ